MMTKQQAGRPAFHLPKPQEKETYARAHGYTIQDVSSVPDTGAVFFIRQVGGGVLAMCVSRLDAIQIAYALAQAYPRGGVQ